MARGPDGRSHGAELDAAAEGLNRMEYELASGLEKIIDRTLESYRGSGPFVYGVHQALSPRMIASLTRRYREAGWSEASFLEGATGAHFLVLRR
jgi:hypothetical protein